MMRRHARIGVLGWMGVVGTAVLVAATGWAQEAPPSEAAARTIYSGSSVVAGIGAVLGTAVYAPFKALVLCPVGAVASGVTFAATGGATETSGYVLRLGCTGTYLVTPAMVQGHQAFRQYDER